MRLVDAVPICPLPVASKKKQVKAKQVVPVSVPPPASTPPVDSSSTGKLPIPVQKPARSAVGGNVAYFPPEDLSVESLAEFIELQQSDSKCEKILSKLKENPDLPFTVDSDGALYHVQVATDMDKKYRSHRRLVVPQALKAFVLRQAHGMIHMGSKRTSHIITGRYYWDGMVADILQWCSSCLVCRKRKTCRPLNAGIPKTMSCDRPFQRISLDLIGKFQKSGTNTH